ncbi:hypothetical protein V2J09_012489 [Rumex salicifolius]
MGGDEAAVLTVESLEEDNSHKDGSLWGDSDDETSGVSELDREWKNRREQFYTHGYREGISAGQIDSAQEGFNNGFKESVLAGYNWGLVRGVTRALAHLPEELRKKMVRTEDNIAEFKSLHESARSISTEAALKLFYDDKNRKNSDSEISDSNNVLEDHFKKLQFLLQQSPEVSINLKVKEKKTPNS